MTLSVLVPYRPDGGHRTRAWEWLARRYAEMPDVELVVRGDDGGANPGEFNHPLAINRAAAAATGDVFMIADCDTAFDYAWVRRAHDMVHGRDAPWVLPRFYAKLDKRSSERLLHGAPDAGIDKFTAEWIGDSVSVAGLVVIGRDAFEYVGGYDERFAFWGSDDVAFALSVDTLVGRHVRLEGSAYHLWHPQPLTQTYGHARHREQYQLTELYKAAVGDGRAMSAVRYGEVAIPRCGHGNIILGCPHADCVEQNAYVEAMRDADNAYYETLLGPFRGPP